MKKYKDYMDGITVSEELHQSILCFARDTHNANSINANSLYSHTSQKKPRKKLIWIGIIATSAAVLLFSVFLWPQLSPQSFPLFPTPFSPQQPSPNITVPGTVSEYQLDFNKANSQTAANLFIPGHFWQELSQEELQAVFPSLSNTHNLTATANFQSDEKGVALFDIAGQAFSSSGLKTKILIAPEKITLDYVLDGEVKTSHVLGTEVRAGYFETNANSQGLKNVIYFANFELAGIAYYVELGGSMAEKEALMQEISSVIGLLIEGGSANLDVLEPLLPELRDERLNLEEARKDTTFGAYLPSSIPHGFIYEEGHRFKNQIADSLSVTWVKGMGYINWRVSDLKEMDKERITSVSDKANYDLSLYPIPRADSVPKHLREIVDNPIFQSNELTLDTVKARAYQVQDAGDEPGERMRLSVLYDDIVIEISSKGPSSEEIYHMLQEIPISR